VNTYFGLLPDYSGSLCSLFVLCCALQHEVRNPSRTASRVVLLLQFNHPEYTSCASYKVQASDGAEQK
jgi:hypothetical protein